jgi:hypothetical protein
VRFQASTTEAKASFTSNTSMSPMPSPAQPSNRSVAGIGPSSIRDKVAADLRGTGNPGQRGAPQFGRAAGRHEQHGRGAVGDLGGDRVRGHQLDVLMRQDGGLQLEAGDVLAAVRR